MTRAFKPGDVVWVGPEGDPLHKVTWQIVDTFESDGITYARLRSGQTNRSRITPIDSLTAFRATEVVE